MRTWRVPYPKAAKPGRVERVMEIATHLGIDLRSFGRSGVLVVGSNGKGSTSAMTAALVEASDSGPVGLFTSPHLFLLNERFRIDGEDISDDELAFHWARVNAAAEAAGRSADFSGFEFLFLIAASWFSARGCAHTVWEAGIGGRHDVTRMIEARYLALTSVDLEHVPLLGRTLLEISLDKADAAPSGATLYVSESCAPLMPAIEAHCKGRGVRASLVPAADLGDFEAPLPGVHQRSNAVLALKLARAIVSVKDDQVRAGFLTLRWPGRLEVLSEGPLIVIDVGHTPDGVTRALEGFQAMRGERAGVLVCGVSADKDASAIIERLAPSFTQIICVAAHHKGAPPAEIATYAQKANAAAEVTVAESVAEARKLALAKAQGGAVYVAGGLFLAAEFKAVHLGRDPSSLAFF